MSTKKIKDTSPNASEAEWENALRLKELFRQSPTGGELLAEANTAFSAAPFSQFQATLLLIER